MGMDLGVTVAYGIEYFDGRMGQPKEEILKAIGTRFDGDPDSQSGDFVEFLEERIPDDADVELEHYSYTSYHAIAAIVARESTTEFFGDCSYLAGPLGYDGREEIYEAELQKMLRAIGCDKLGLTGSWLILVSG